MEQALYCLFTHPSKKSKAKHLVDHGASAILLKWDNCQNAYIFLALRVLPEFDDYKMNSISADTEAMFKRIFALVPEEFTKSERKRDVMRFLSGKNVDFDKCKTAFPPFFQNVYEILFHDKKLKRTVLRDF